MDLKALALLLDPVSGQIESPARNAKRCEKRVREKEEDPNRSISLTSILSPSPIKPNSTF
jgi:hypothetical protein